MSKGSKRRDCQVSQAEYQANWDLIYNKKAIKQYKEVDALKIRVINKVTDNAVLTK